MQLGLRTKFLIPTVLLVALGMTLSMTISYINSRNALDRAIKQQIIQIADSTMIRLNSWAEKTQLDLSNWSTGMIYQSALTDDFMGKVARKSANSELAIIMAGYPFYESLSVVDGTGKVVASSSPEIIEKNTIAEENVVNELMSGNITFTDVFISPSSGKPVIAISSPIQAKEGAASGALIGIVDVEYVSKNVIDDVKVGEQGYTYLFDRTGLIITHPDKENIFKSNIKEYDFGRTMMENKEGILIYTFDNLERIISYKTEPFTGWCIGVGVATSEIFSPIKKMGWMSLTIAFIVVLLLALGMWIMSGTLIIKPLSKVADGLKDIAEGEGDLRARLNIQSEDEIGRLSKWFNTFAEKLQSIIEEIGINSDSLSASAVQLTSLAGHMSGEADNMSTKSNTVAASAEEMTVSISSVAAAMEEASTNMSIVASSAEEMTATINEIAKNSEKARFITGDAVSQADDASQKIGELGKAAQEIGKVTEAITEISEQTNLLALNATIEAARAGEAGKGFAVVANEIKELARQTAEATQDIKARIDAIQNSTTKSVSQVEEISKIINDVNEIVSTIAAAVEEQSVSTREIADNVTQASRGIHEVSENTAKSSSVADEIAKDIADVNQSSSEISSNSSQVDMSAQELSKLAKQLKEMVGTFKVH
jgi:methyl-accepting chemotaxis protein